METHALAVHSAAFTPELAAPRWAAVWNALFFALREHAAVSPAEPLPAEPLQEGVANAYCPRGFPAAFAVGARAGTLRVRRPGRAKEWVYRTWEEGKSNGHDEDTCEMCAARRKEEERRPQRTADDTGCDRDADMGEEAEDEARLRRTREAFRRELGVDVDRFVEEQQARADEDDMDVDADPDADADADPKAGAACAWPCDGVQDVIITGEVCSVPPFLLLRRAAPR